ncbi:hypothetical protein [Enterococcus sp. DIV0086]|uniref:hypothetical protein n=1 Tax=Enterococcus sp. DIV0086 TaxID=2774655 RepID=UPI003D2791D0
MKLKLSRKSKFFCLAMSFFVVLGLFVSVGVNVHASEVSSDNSFSYDIDKLDKYVTFDNVSLKYSISDNAKSELSKSELTFLQNKISETNSVTSNIVIDPAKETLTTGDKTITISQNVESNNGISLGFSEGKNDAKVYWWGVRIWLSKTTVNLIGAGVTIGGIWVPEPVVSKVLATVGVVIGLCPGGIVFNSTPPIANFWGFEFQ